MLTYKGTDNKMPRTYSLFSIIPVNPFNAGQ